MKARLMSGHSDWSGVIRVGPHEAGMDELEPELREMEGRISW